MTRLVAFARAAHAAPTVAVTVVMSTFAWSLGWRGVALFGVAAAILVGQLSVGWSNDAYDAELDTVAGRSGKPTVSHGIASTDLWIAATMAVIASCVLSWLVAGLVGGSFHVFALGMAWLYNVRLSRTVWSWLPYALAFGAMPAFLSVGLDGQAPPSWTVAVFALIAVSAHLANALPDLESDAAVGRDGLVIRLGARRATVLCWVLLAAGTAILVLATRDAGAVAMLPVAAFAAALAYGWTSRRRAAMFNALLVAIVVDVVTLVISPAL